MAYSTCRGSCLLAAFLGMMFSTGVMSSPRCEGDDELAPFSFGQISNLEPEPWFEQVLGDQDAPSAWSPPSPQSVATGKSLEEKYADLSDRFTELERQFSALTGVVEDTNHQATDPTTVKSGTPGSTLRVQGRVQIDALGFDTPSPSSQATLADFNDGQSVSNSLGFRRLRLGVRGTVRDQLIYKFEAEFAEGQTEFRDAYLGWTDLPWLGTLLIGNQKRPFGLDHLNSSRFNTFLERPLIVEAFNEEARRLGIQAYGVTSDQAWNWRYGVFTQRNIQAIGRSVDDHLQLQVAARIANTIWYDEVSGGRGYAHWAISANHSDSTTSGTNEAVFRTRPEARTANPLINTEPIDGADHYEFFGVEGVVNVGSFQAVGEYQNVWVSRDPGFQDVQFGGGYFSLSYFLTGEHIPWDRRRGTIGRIIPLQNFWFVDQCDACRDSGWGAWQVAVRYGYADLSDDDILGGEGESLTAAVNWYWSPNARMQFNYIAGDINRRDLGDGNGPRGASYDVWAARFSIDF